METDGAVTETADAVVETIGATEAAGGDAEDEKPRMDLSQLMAIVEALVFASPEPLTPKMLLKLLNDEPKEDVLAAVEAVKQGYEARPGCTWRRSPVVIRSPPGPNCTTGCGACSTSGPRRSCRCIARDAVGDRL